MKLELTGWDGKKHATDSVEFPAGDFREAMRAVSQLTIKLNRKLGWPRFNLSLGHSVPNWHVVCGDVYQEETNHA